MFLYLIFKHIIWQFHMCIQCILTIISTPNSLWTWDTYASPVFSLCHCHLFLLFLLLFCPLRLSVELARAQATCQQPHPWRKLTPLTTTSSHQLPTATWLRVEPPEPFPTHTSMAMKSLTGLISCKPRVCSCFWSLNLCYCNVRLMKPMWKIIAPKLLSV